MQSWFCCLDLHILFHHGGKLVAIVYAPFCRFPVGSQLHAAASSPVRLQVVQSVMRDIAELADERRGRRAGAPDGHRRCGPVRRSLSRPVDEARGSVLPT